MDLNQLKYFASVARLGNISRAAQELYVTQPNLSKSIARLEEELGVPLFEHRKGKIVLNDYGRCFLTSVNLSLGELENGVLAIRRMYESSQNILALGCSIDDLIPDVLRDFFSAHPEIGIRQFHCAPAELVDRLYRRTLDLAVTDRLPVDNEGFVWEELDRCEFVILVGRDHPLAGRDFMSVSELAQEKLICDRSRMDEQTLTAICRRHGFTPQIQFEVENSHLVYSLLADGRGVAFMPMVHMRKINHDFPDSGIHMVRLKDEVAPSRLYLLRRKEFKWTSAAETFTKFLRRWLEQDAEAVARLTGEERISGDGAIDE